MSYNSDVDYDDLIHPHLTGFLSKIKCPCTFQGSLDFALTIKDKNSSSYYVYLFSTHSSKFIANLLLWNRIFSVPFPLGVVSYQIPILSLRFSYFVCLTLSSSCFLPFRTLTLPFPYCHCSFYPFLQLCFSKLLAILQTFFLPLISPDLPNLSSLSVPAITQTTPFLFLPFCKHQPFLLHFHCSKPPSESHGKLRQ